MILKIALACLFFTAVNSITDQPILIITSFDAFRYDFFNKTKELPYMQKVRQEGTCADYFTNVFPTKTFPNHQSIATGLFPDIHGVIANSFYDPDLKKIVKLSPEMYNTENIVPIWRYNEDQGNGRYSASMMWPGAAFPYQGKNVTHLKDFDVNFDWFKRVDTVISWLTHPTKPANLVMFYIEEPDNHAHALGINAHNITEILKKLDKVTEYLDEQLEKHDLKSRTNIIQLSDHGMISVTPPYFINITQYLKNGSYIRAGATPTMQLTPVDKRDEEEIYRNLTEASKTHNFRVYKKKDYLPRWHFTNNKRTPPIFVMADVGYALDDLIEQAPNMAKALNFSLTNSSEFGVHGYDYNVTNMHPYFMARGPRIKTEHKVKPFDSVDLFSLFCEILEIPQIATNGSYNNVKDILKSGSAMYTVPSLLIVIVGGILLSLLFISCAVFVTLIVMKHRQNKTTAAALNKRFPQNMASTIEAQHLLDPEDC